MKFAVVILAVVAAASAQQYQPGSGFQRFPAQQYNPYRNQYSTPAPYRPFVSSTPAPFVPYIASTVAPTYAPVPVAKYSNLDARNAQIVKYGNEINPDGSYSYYYETDNGIAAQEQGTPRNLGGNPPAVPDVAQGSFSYTSPEGVPVSVSYVADEFGFRPSGNVLPVGPPIPPQIARALEYIARNSKN